MQHIIASFAFLKKNVFAIAVLKCVALLLYSTVSRRGGGDYIL